MSRLDADAVQLVAVLPAGQDAVAHPSGPADPEGLLRVVRRHPAPVVALVDETAAAAFAADGFELFAGRTAREGLPTAYLCRDFVCRLPVTRPDRWGDAPGT